MTAIYLGPIISTRKRRRRKSALCDRRFADALKRAFELSEVDYRFARQLLRIQLY